MIFLKHVSKKYLNSTALDDVTLEIKSGEVVVLKGVSGSGKSTLLSLIAGILKPSEGEIVVDGKKISKLPDHFASEYRRENIGIVFQMYNLVTTISVSENILLPLIPLNLDKEIVDEKISFVLKMLNIEHKKDEIVKNLSGGERQRVAIARANVNNPKIILADEPTANLDKKLSLEFIDIVQKLKEDGKTIIISTHDPLFFDLDAVDRVVEIEDGKLI